MGLVEGLFGMFDELIDVVIVIGVEFVVSDVVCVYVLVSMVLW